MGRLANWTGLGLAAVMGVSAAAAADFGEVQKLEALLKQQRERQTATEAELSGLGGEREALKARMREHAGALYRLQRGGLLPLSGGLEALLRHASHLRRLEDLVGADIAALQELEQRGSSLRAETSRLSGEIARSEASIVSTRRSVAARHVERERESDFARTFTHSQGPQGRTLRTEGGSLSLLDEGALPSRFADQRGNLALPVSGPNGIRDASRDESDGDGLEFVSRPGATVRASEAGRVAFADTYASYGRIVILDHGERYYTVYAGMGRMDVRVGDDVSRSARLGSVGESGVLYFEVRRGTRNQKPRPWLGL